jgi:hypothetical protein
MLCVEAPSDSINRLSPEEFANHLDRKLQVIVADMEQAERYFSKLAAARPQPPTNANSDLLELQVLDVWLSVY